MANDFSCQSKTGFELGEKRLLKNRRIGYGQRERKRSMLIRLMRRTLTATALLAWISTTAANAAGELTTIRIAHNGFSSERPRYVGKDAPQQLIDLIFLP
jgi:hypothetical protein